MLKEKKKKQRTPTKFSLLHFASLVTSILPATLVQQFIGDFKEKNSVRAFRMILACQSYYLCKGITHNEVLSLSLDLHFEVIAAAAVIGLLMKRMPYVAGSQGTTQQYKLYHN